MRDNFVELSNDEMMSVDGGSVTLGFVIGFCCFSGGFIYGLWHG